MSRKPKHTAEEWQKILSARWVQANREIAALGKSQPRVANAQQRLVQQHAYSPQRAQNVTKGHNRPTAWDISPDSECFADVAFDGVSTLTCTFHHGGSLTYDFEVTAKQAREAKRRCLSGGIGEWWNAVLRD